MRTRSQGTCSHNEESYIWIGALNQWIECTACGQIGVIPRSWQFISQGFK